jgi:hypothetical protein
MKVSLSRSWLANGLLFREFAAFLISLALSFSATEAAYAAPNVALLVQNKDSLDVDEANVKGFLDDNQIAYAIADAAMIKNQAIALSSYNVLYMRTGSEPAAYTDPDVVSRIKTRVQNGGKLILEYYGLYLGQYLGVGSITLYGWGPAVFDAIYYVQPITQSSLFANIPNWVPPQLPDNGDQLLSQLTQRGGYTYPLLSFNRTHYDANYWHLATTYGWSGQSTDSGFCAQYPGLCTSERSVHLTGIQFASLGNGTVLDLTGGLGQGNGTSASNLTLGPVVTRFRLNAINNSLFRTGQLAAYYPFDGNANDRSGNGNNGTVYSATFTNGILNKALQFTGAVTSRVEVPSTALLSPSQAVTVSVWARVSGFPTGYSNLIYKAGAKPTSSGFKDRSYTLWLRNDRGVHLTATAAGAAEQTVCDSAPNLYSMNAWVHVAGVVNAAAHRMAIYVNGAKVQECPFNGNSLLSGNYPLRIGGPFKTLDDQSGLNGIMDDVRIYNGALSDTAISQIYSAIPQRVVLLLHGMNSDPYTSNPWNDFVKNQFNGSCPVIFKGVAASSAVPNAQGRQCYQIKFGRYDIGGLRGLWDDQDRDGVYEYVVATNDTTSFGDFSTFGQLGAEVKDAVHAILNKTPNAKVTLVGHSRGGLAARAFLQQPVSSVEKASVSGLLTIGTPHQGSRLGRIYNYLGGHLRYTCADGTLCQKDWQVADFLNDKIPCDAFFHPPTPLDVRRPTIAYLADTTSPIKNLNANIAYMPAGIVYGELAFKGFPLGLLKQQTATPEYSIFDRPLIADICYQVSATAQTALLGTGGDPYNYNGDGIVTLQAQSYIRLPGFPGKLILHREYSNAVHADETKKVYAISDAINAIISAMP